MKLVSWNVNSLRAAEIRFLQFVNRERPEIILLQEVRAKIEQISDNLQNIEGYNLFVNDSGRPGYGGTAIYYKQDLGPDLITKTTGEKILDDEGRTIVLVKNNIAVVNFYIPNGNRNEERLQYKLKFYEAAKKYLGKLLNKYATVIVGADLNVAATEIDLFSPKTNKRHSGYLAEEREWFQEVLDLGMVDSFRVFNKIGGNYTWWSMRDPTRAQNKGWRYDYFLVSKNTEVVKSAIFSDIFGSDHCPILLEVRTK